MGAWGWDHAWLDTLLILFLLIGLVTSQVNRVHGRRLGALLARAGEGPVNPELRQVLLDPLHWATVITTSLLALGIVFLMTTKPDLTGTLIAIAVALALGIIGSWLAIRSQSENATTTSHQPSATSQSSARSESPLPDMLVADDRS